MAQQNNRLRRAHSVSGAARHFRGDRLRGSRNSIVFVGESDELRSVYNWAYRRGFVPADIPHLNLACAVVDEDILDGMCTPVEADILQRVRDRGFPCLPPSHARNWLVASRGERLRALSRRESG